MDSDSKKSTICENLPEHENLDRRQFFNGLGKWSLAVIAAATALRDGPEDIRGGNTFEFETAPGRGGDRPQLIARKKPKKPKGPHTDRAFAKHSQHYDYVSKKKPPGGKAPAPGGTLEKAK